MFFREVIGQSLIKNQLIRSVAENRVSHALLFLGPEGCGNLAMALAFAQYVNCEDKQDITLDDGTTSADSCGKCPSCIKTKKLIHPDLHFTFPFIKDDDHELCADWMPEWRVFAEETPYANYNYWINSLTETNKQGNITSKECQDILRRLSLKNYEGIYKIQILWLPEYLREEGNRLLKLLEEPPDNTLFILVAHDAERIINTILSRVQIVKFPRLPDADVAHYLQEVWEVAPNAATSLAALAGGNLQEAIDLIDAHENANTVMIREWMEPCFRQHVKQLFAWNDQFLKLSREQQKNFFRYCLHFFREVLLLETGAPQLTRLTEAERRTAEGLGKVLGVERLMAMLELFDKCIYFVERNVNGKIMMSYVSVVLLRQFNKQIQTTQPFYDRWAL